MIPRRRPPELQHELDRAYQRTQRQGRAALWIVVALVAYWLLGARGLVALIDWLLVGLLAFVVISFVIGLVELVQSPLAWWRAVRHAPGSHWTPPPIDVDEYHMIVSTSPTRSWAEGMERARQLQAYEERAGDP